MRIRPALLADIPKLLELHALDREAGHYFGEGDPKIDGEEFSSVVSGVISSGFRKITIKHEKLKGYWKVEAKIKVCVDESGAILGFCFESEVIRNVSQYVFNTDSVSELYMVSVAPHARGKKIGCKIVDDWISEAKVKYPVLFARTLPKSHIMREMLLKRGFQEIKIGNMGEALLARGNSSFVRFRYKGSLNNRCGSLWRGILAARRVLIRLLK